MQLLLTGKQRAAKTSRVNVQGVDLAFASWGVKWTGEDLKTTNFLSTLNVAPFRCFDEGILGPEECALDFGGDWDAGNTPTGNPPGLFPRDDLGPVVFFQSRGDAGSWAYPLMRVRAANSGGEIRGKVPFTTSGFSQGVWTNPVVDN
jgi:hypothetical protein